MEAQSSGSNQVVFDVPIDFDAGDWHEICVTYCVTNCCVFLEGQVVTNTGPINYFPSESDCTNYGIFVGSLSTNGECQAHGQFQDLETYDSPLSAEEIAQDYADTAAIILDRRGSLPSGGLSPDDGPPLPEGGTNSGSGGGGGSPDIPSQNPGTNLWLIISLQSNSVIVTLSNTVAGVPYLLLAATNLNGPWITNQSLLAATNTAVAAPIPLGKTNAVFFIAEQAVLGTLKWKVFLGGDGDNVLAGGIDGSPALGADGTIYITATCNGSSTSNLLYAIDALTGHVKWSNNVFTNDFASSDNEGCEFSSSPAIGSNGTIYIGSDDGHLYAVGTNGITRWTVDLGWSAFASPAIGSDGTIYIGTDVTPPGTAYSGFFAITNGALKWTFTPIDTGDGEGGDVDGSPAVASDGTIYFLTEGNRLYAVSAGGNINWFLPVPGQTEPDSTPAIGPDGTIYIGSKSDYLYAVNSDGSLKWIFNVSDMDSGNGQIQASPTIGPNGVIYVGTGDFNDDPNYDNPGNLYALNTNGGLLWVFTNATAATISSPAISANGTVYVGCADNNLYAVTNGSEAWAFQTGGPIVSSPVIGADGTVYVGSGDGFLYAIYGTSRLATNAPWPMFHNNPAHTGLQLPSTTPPADCGAPFVHGGDLFMSEESGEPASFYFEIDATNAGGTWYVFTSSNLTNWTETGSLTLGGDPTGSTNGYATFTTNFESAVTNQFYILSSGTNLSNSCRSRVIGFMNMTIVPGTNLIADQLYQVDDNLVRVGPMNTLKALYCDPFLPVSPPWRSENDGTQIMKWNGQGFDVFSFEYIPEAQTGIWYDTNGMGNGDATLLPGIGVLMNNVTGAPFTNSFVGLIREQQVFQIQPGTNYLSATLPVAGAITNITGYVPRNGDIIKLWNTNSQAFQSYTNGSSGWSPGSPVVGAGEGFVLITANTNTWTNTWDQVFP